ncbi:MAG TPA: hypothetical protein VIT20_06920 [Propionibacteriaceae bacterium]
MLRDPAPHPLIRLDELPPIDDRFAAEVWLEPGNLVAVSDELGAQVFAMIDDVVTFTVRTGAAVQRWRGQLGHRGLTPLTF